MVQDEDSVRAAARTAISRKNPSAPATWLFQHDRLIGKCLDYGCGKGADADAYGMAKYDPFYYPIQPRSHYFDTITCTYVLNVLSEQNQLEAIAAIKLLLTEQGTAYFAVRRDLVSNIHTHKGYCQRNVFLAHPFVSLVRNNGFELYELPSEKQVGKEEVSTSHNERTD